MKEKLLKLKRDIQNLRSYREDEVELKRIRNTLDMYLDIIFPAEKEEWHSKIFNIRFQPHLVSDGFFGVTVPPDRGEFQQGITELSNVIDLIIEKMEISNSVSSKGHVTDNKHVFIVHGHDIEVKEAVSHVITKLGLEPVLLSEESNSGKTIIEKLEYYGRVGYAIILLTPCDKGKAATEKTYNLRARQNVNAEMGFFIGLLGRDKVSILRRGNVEIPSDFKGLGYISYDNSSWKFELARELKSAGYNVDANKLI